MRTASSRSADIKAAARGRWPRILRAVAGLSDEQLRDRHQPCPNCGGRDRYRFTDRHESGDYFCNGCGPGNGFRMVMLMNNCTFPKALDLVGDYLRVGTAVDPPLKPQKPAPRQEPRAVKASTIMELMAVTKPLSAPEAKPARDYLENRLGRLPDPLPRLGCARLPYHGDGKVLGEFDCLIGFVRTLDGKVVQAQRTYILDGKKAPVSSPRKFLRGAMPLGAAVWLYMTPRDPCAPFRMVAGEGIETTLALRQHIGGDLPAFAFLTAGSLAKADIPFSCSQVDCAVDMDDAGRYAVADLMINQESFYTEVTGYCPPSPAKDWADIYGGAP
jgi:putative DNA primase/helicase